MADPSWFEHLGLIVALTYIASFAGFAFALQWRRAGWASRLRALADRLEGGEVAGKDPLTHDGVRISGRIDGREVTLHVALPAYEGRGPLPLRTLAYEVDVAHAPCDLEASHPPGETVLTRWLFGVPDRRVRGFDVKTTETPGATTLLRDEAGELLEQLAVEGGRVVLREGKLRFERPASEWVGVDALQADMRLLARIAATLERTSVVVAQGLAARFLWTGGGAARCPFCRDDLAADAADVVACEACGTLHHRECLEQAHGCTVFGCRGGPGRRDAEPTLTA